MYGKNNFPQSIIITDLTSYIDAELNSYDTPQKGGLYHTRSRSVLQEAVDTHDTKLFTVYLHASRVGMLHVFIYPNFFFHTKIHNHLINHLHCMLNNTGHG